MNSPLKSYKNWLIPLVLILLIVGGFFLIKWLNDNEGDDSFISEGDPTVRTPSIPVGETFFDEQLEEMNQNNFSYSDALASGAIANCNKIDEDEAMKNQCRDQINYSSATQNQNLAFCEAINNGAHKIQCLNSLRYTIAMRDQDQSLCDSITETSLQKTCSEQFISLEIQTSPEQLDCQSLPSDSLKTTCWDNFYADEVLRTQDLQVCENLSTEEKQNNCTRTVIENQPILATLQKTNQLQDNPQSGEALLNFCNTASDQQKLICEINLYNRLAFEQRDITYCDEISNQTDVLSCIQEQGDRLDQYYLNKAQAHDDKMLCEEVSAPEVRELCLL